MEDNSISRQLSIDLITDTPNEIIVWFNDLWPTINIVETSVYHQSGGELIYYKMIDNRKQWIFFRDDTRSKFWCNYTHYWLLLESKFSLNRIEIQGITKVLIDNALNNGNNVVSNALISTPKVDQYRSLSKVENVLNVDISPPDYRWEMENKQILNALNISIIS